MPAAYKYYYWVISEPQAEVGLSRAPCPTFGIELWGFFCIGLSGFCPKKEPEKWKSQLGSTWMVKERERSKTERKKWEKKNLPRLFLF